MPGEIQRPDRAGLPTARVQHAFATDVSGSATALAATWAAPTTPGNLLVAVVGWTSAGAHFWATGDGWIEACSAAISTTGGVRILYNWGAAPHAGDEVFVASAAGRLAVEVVEYQGQFLGLAATSTGTGTTATADTGVAPTIIDNGGPLAVAGFTQTAGGAGNSTIADASVTPGPTAATLDKLSGTDRMAFEAAEAYGPLGFVLPSFEGTAAITAGANNWAAAIAVFSTDSRDKPWPGYGTTATGNTRPTGAG